MIKEKDNFNLEYEWNGDTLDYIKSSYMKDGRFHYKITTGFVVVNAVSGLKHNVYVTAEECMNRIVNSIEGKGYLFATLKSGTNSYDTNGIPYSYVNSVAYLVSYESTLLEDAIEKSRTKLNTIKGIFRSSLKAVVEDITKTRFERTFEIMSNSNENWISMLMGCPTVEGEMVRDTIMRRYPGKNDDDSLGNKSKEGKTVITPIMESMQMNSTEYVILSILQPKGKGRLERLLKKVSNIMGVLRDYQAINVGDAISVGIPVFFSLGSSESSNTSNIENTSSTKTVSNGNIETNTNTTSQVETDTVGENSSHVNTLTNTNGTNKMAGTATQSGISAKLFGIGANGGISDSYSNGEMESSGVGVSDMNGFNRSNALANGASNSQAKAVSNTEAASNTLGSGKVTGSGNSRNMGGNGGASVTESSSMSVTLTDEYTTVALNYLEKYKERLMYALENSGFFEYTYLITTNKADDDYLRAVCESNLKGSSVDPIFTEQVDIANKNKAIKNIMAIDISEEDIDSNDDLLEQGFYGTLILPGETPLFNLPATSFCGINVIKHFPPHGYYQMPKVEKKRLYRGIGHMVDPATFAVINVELYVASRGSVIMLGITGEGKTNNAVRVIGNMIEMIPHMKVVMLNNKKNENDFTTTRNLFTRLMPKVKCNLYTVGGHERYGELLQANFFRIPEGVALNEWIYGISAVLCKNYGLAQGSHAILLKQLSLLYAEFGIFGVYENRGHKYDSWMDCRLFRDAFDEVLKNCQNMINQGIGFDDEMKDIKEIQAINEIENQGKYGKIFSNLSKMAKNNDFVAVDGVINRHKSGEITLRDLKDKISDCYEYEKKKNGINSNPARSMGSIEERFDSALTGQMEYLFYEDYGKSIEEVLLADDNIVIINTSDLEPQQQQIITELFIRHMFGWVRANKYKYDFGDAPEQRSFMLFIEEATNYFGDAAVRDSVELSGESIWEKIAYEGRSSGFFYFILGQSVDRIPKCLLSESKNVFLLALPNEEDVVKILTACGCLPERRDMDYASWISKQPFGIATYICKESGKNHGDYTQHEYKCTPYLYKFDKIS